MNLNIIIIAHTQISAFYGINVRMASIKSSINQTKYQTKMINSIKKNKGVQKNKITNIFRQTNNKPKSNVKSKKLYMETVVVMSLSCNCTNHNGWSMKMGACSSIAQNTLPMGIANAHAWQENIF